MMNILSNSFTARIESRLVKGPNKYEITCFESSVRAITALGSTQLYYEVLRRFQCSNEIQNTRTQGMRNHELHKYDLSQFDLNSALGTIEFLYPALKVRYKPRTTSQVRPCIPLSHPTKKVQNVILNKRSLTVVRCSVTETCA